MAAVYVLYSGKIDKFYVGSCKDITQRIYDHLHKKYRGSFTSKTDDWSLFWYLDALQYEQARAIEVHLKRMKSRIYFNNLLRYPEIAMRLKEKYG